MKKEKDYYRFIAEWFQSEKGCDPTALEHRFDGLELLTGDVVGAREGRFTHVCELKPYPYPVGASGYGSVGQALALRDYAEYVYVGCVASESSDDPERSWELVSKKRSVAALLSAQGIKEPTCFEEYLDAVRQVFEHFYGGLGLRLLVVREPMGGECRVLELVPTAAGASDQGQT